MISRQEHDLAQHKAAEMIVQSGIRISEDERKKIEVVDFGLSNLPVEGAQILAFFNTKRISVKA